MSELIFDNNGHDGSVGADTEIIDVPRAAAIKPGAKPASPPPAPSGEPDAKLIFENALGAGASDEVIDLHDGDPEAKAVWDEVVQAVGGPEQVPVAAQDLREALALYPGDREIIEGGGGLTLEENANATLTVIAGYREALSSPKKAAAILKNILAHPQKEPFASYIEGRLSGPAHNEYHAAYTKLQQASRGDKPVGPEKGRGDGYVR